MSHYTSPFYPLDALLVAPFLPSFHQTLSNLFFSLPFSLFSIHSLHPINTLSLPLLYTPSPHPLSPSLSYTFSSYRGMLIPSLSPLPLDASSGI